MHELHPLAEQALRAQGFTDVEIDELRRTGQIVRTDDTGASVSIDSTQLTTAQVSPETIEMLRRFKRFIPKQSMHHVEMAIGEDIDGDGRIGAGSGAPLAPIAPAGPAASSTTQAPVFAGATSGAMPTATPSGPFVDKQRRASLLPVTLLIMIVAAAIYYFAVR